MINGFLCFGANNYVSFANLNGLTIVNSYPENQGGKTTFSIDSFKFLLYGKTTRTDKNEEVFNQHWDNNDLIVRGMVTLNDKDIIIEIVSNIHSRMGFRPARTYLLKPKSIPQTHNGKIQYPKLKDDFLDQSLADQEKILYPEY